MAIIDISARVVGATRRLEVYGTKGTAIIVEPFEPGEQIKLILDADRGEYKEGEQMLDVPGVARQETCAYSQHARPHPIAPLWPPLTHAWAICCALAHATLPE